MAFDEKKYVESFIKKLRGARVLPDDLLARYDITLPATDAEIAERVASVRGFWNRIYLSKTSAAQVARMCRAADERIRAEHGAVMQSCAWWEAQQGEQQARVEVSIQTLAREFRQRYGDLGVVTLGIADRFACMLDLTPLETARAVRQANIRLVEGIVLPDSEPFASFRTLLSSMSECAVHSVPELVHPDIISFSLVEKYANDFDPQSRLDLAAIVSRLAEMDKFESSIVSAAWRSALTILSRAINDGADLHEIALYHLMVFGQEFAVLSPTVAAEKLHRIGLSRTDSAMIAVVIDERSLTARTSDLGETRKAEWLAAMAQLAELIPVAHNEINFSTIPFPRSSQQPPESPSTIVGLQMRTNPSSAIAKPVTAIRLAPEWDNDGPLTVMRRVQLGVPTMLPITQSELESDKYLANAVAARKDLYFCLIRITPTFHEGNGGTIVQAFVEVKLKTRGRQAIYPKVWSMNPEVVEEKGNRSRQLTGSGGPSPGRATLSFDSSYDKYEPFITAYGLQSSSAYWKFTKTRGREIRGSHTLEMVVCIPWGCAAEAIINIYALTRKRRFGLVPIRSNIDDDSCRITLPAETVEQVPVLPD
jgi:hypothetical protein